MHSIAIGYGVTGNTAATTGQITSMVLADNKDVFSFPDWGGVGYRGNGGVNDFI